MLYCMCVHSKVIVGYDPTKQQRRFSFQFWIRALGLLWCRNCDILTCAKGPWVCFSLFCREMLNKLLSVILPMWGVKSLIHSPHGMESHSVIPRSCQNIIAMHIVDHPGVCSYLKASLCAQFMFKVIVQSRHSFMLSSLRVLFFWLAV